MLPCRRRRKEATPHCYWGGGKQGGEVTRCPRCPEEQGKHLNAAVCGFHTAPSSLMPQEEYPPREVVASKFYLQLAFGCEGGGSGGSGVETIERSPSGSHLDAREVVVVADVLKREKGPPLAHVKMQGRVEGFKRWKQR